MDRDPRVILAAERTLLAWIRTGLAMMGFGFVVARFGLFLQEISLARGVEMSRGGGSLWAGTALVIIGVVVNIHAAVVYTRVRERYARGDVEMKGSRAGVVVAGLLAVIGIAIAAYLVMYR